MARSAMFYSLRLYNFRVIASYHIAKGKPILWSGSHHNYIHTVAYIILFLLGHKQDIDWSFSEQFTLQHSQSITVEVQVTLQ
jgi:hypothetical protein